MKAIIFDKDGIIIDSEPMHFRAHVQALKELADFELTIQQYKQFGMSKSRPSFYSNCLAIAEDAELVEQIGNRKEEIYGQLQQTPNEVAGFSDFLKRVVGKFTLAIASTAAKADIMADLRILKIISEDENPFTVIISGLEVENTKPAPDVYLKCVERLGIEKQEIIVVEDSLSGVLSAKAAGLFCASRTSDFWSEEELSSAGADFIFNDYAELAQFLMLE